MIKAITFDLDGVYFSSQSYSNFMTNLPKKVTDEEKIRYVLRKSPELTVFISGKMSENDYWEFVRKELGVELDNEGIFKVLRDSYEINSDVQSYVLETRARGLKTCICSNNSVTRIRELNTKFNFLKDFDVTVFSYETGVMKPDKGIFEELVRRSGVEANEVVYSDDDPSKLSGALEIGMNAFVYEDIDKFKETIQQLGGV